MSKRASLSPGPLTRPYAPPGYVFCYTCVRTLHPDRLIGLAGAEDHTGHSWAIIPDVRRYEERYFPVGATEQPWEL